MGEIAQGRLTAAERMRLFVEGEDGMEPAMLRHSMALRTLIALHNALDRRLGLSPAERLHYEEVYGQVWLMVKDMLGHRSEQVTRDVYLSRCAGCSWSRCWATTATP
ncbi:hypothetical protein ACFV30_34240 [Streptomyces sp. NPDC059752]|uniref:hypothetical protein n=1 Tax=unclassified Streptomyces TaxID=2593676 RepID=UPI0036470121